MDAGEAAALTDLHTHILPDIDDGAADLGEATIMARAALDDGIACLAATPHSLRWPPGTDQAGLEARVAALSQHLASMGLPLTIVAGAEMALIPALVQQVDAGEHVTLNRSRYLLIEPLYASLPSRLDEMLFELQMRGLVPILAHPERSASLQREPQQLRALVEGGLLIQITAASLEGRRGRAAERVVRFLLRENLVHVIASDAHSPGDGGPRLARAQALAAEVIGAGRAQALVAANPAAILADQELEVEAPAQPGRRWFWQRRG
jgi:protein-tyrosine phosphatase